MGKRMADQDLLIQFKSFIKGEGITLRSLASAMGYNENYVSQVLNGFRTLYPVFRESLRRALLQTFLIGPDSVNKEVASLQDAFDRQP